MDGWEVGWDGISWDGGMGRWENGLVGRMGRLGEWVGVRMG